MVVSINGGAQNEWFLMENPINMEDLGHLGVPPILGNPHIHRQVLRCS